MASLSYGHARDTMAPHPTHRAVKPMSTQPILGVDVGGTFTDFVYFDGAAIRIHKLLSTRADPSVALLAGMGDLAAAPGTIISHGTTAATNAVLEHAGARTALIATRGFRDVLAIGRQTRPALYRLAFPPRWLPVPDELRFEVTERVSAEGQVLVPLDHREAAAVLDQAVAAGAESLAVCLLFSFLHPEHEAVLKRLAEARGLNVSLSSEILPEYREFERTSTTVLNAYVSPLMARYLTALEAALTSPPAPLLPGEGGVTPPSLAGKGAGGLGHRLWIMQSSGGILSAAAARREAVRTLLSGPAAGVAGAFHVATAAGHSHVITFDMGGTSTDVSLADGAIRRTAEGSIEGWPVRVPMMDIHTVGAGGGSIAWADAGGALRVGPQSAGSEPGPACYGRGGSFFTVSDANLLLGRLDAAHFLGGRMALDRPAAEAAAAPLAASLGLSPIALAEGVVRVANARMEQAIRVISVARGFDPRAFTLLPFGGAGPMHALELAEALHIGQVLVPRYPGVLSALGLVLADFTVDHSRTVMWPLEETDAARLEAAFRPLLDRARAELEAEGWPSPPAPSLPPALRGSPDRGRGAASPQDWGAGGAVRLETALDLRYRGQSFELTVPVEGYDPVEAARRFHASHAQRYGYAHPSEADARRGVELVNVRVTGRGVRPKPELPRERRRLRPTRAPAGWARRASASRAPGMRRRCTSGRCFDPATGWPARRSSSRKMPPPSSSPAGAPRWTRG